MNGTKISGYRGKMKKSEAIALEIFIFSGTLISFFRFLCHFFKSWYTTPREFK